MPIAAGEPPSPEPAASKPPTPPMPIAGPEPAPPKPPTPPMPIAGPAPTPTESQLAPPRPPTPQTPTGAPQQPESPAPHVPSHGPHQPRRTAPAPPWAKMPIGEPPPAPSRPSASPAEPPTRPAPQHSRRARRGHRYRTDTERNVGKVATGPSIQARLRAEEASGAQLAPGTEPSPAPLGQPRSYLAPPTPI